MTNVIAKIDSGSVEPAQYKNAITYRVDMPTDMTSEDLTKPEAWINVKRKFPQLAAGNIIECLKEDMSLFVELMVIGTSHDIVFTKVLREVKLSVQAEKEEGKTRPHEVKWLRGAKKWGIVRTHDNQELRSGFSSSEEAEECLKNNY